MHLKLRTLKFRCMRGDMIEVLKLTHNYIYMIKVYHHSFLSAQYLILEAIIIIFKSYFSLQFTETYFYSVYC